MASATCSLALKCLCPVDKFYLRGDMRVLRGNYWVLFAY